MVNGYFHEYSLSVNEYGAGIYMAGYAEIGEAYFQGAHPRTKRAVIESLVEGGRRSLAARGLTIRNGLTLEEDLESAIHTAIRFKKLLQVMLKTSKKEPGFIANILIGEDGKFTANWEDEEVHLLYAGVEDIPNLVCDWASLSKPAAPEFPAEMRKIGVHTLSRLKGSSFIVRRYLRDQGYSEPWASTLADLSVGAKWGSVVLLDVPSEKIHQADFEEAGAGVVFSEGKKYCWIFRFDETNPAAVGEMVEGSQARLKEEIARLVG